MIKKRLRLKCQIRRKTSRLSDRKSKARKKEKSEIRYKNKSKSIIKYKIIQKWIN